MLQGFLWDLLVLVTKRVGCIDVVIAKARIQIARRAIAGPENFHIFCRTVLNSSMYEYAN